MFVAVVEGDGVVVIVTVTKVSDTEEVELVLGEELGVAVTVTVTKVSDVFLTVLELNDGDTVEIEEDADSVVVVYGTGGK